MTAEKAETLAQPGLENNVLELTPEEITTIDLIFTKEQLAVAEERLAAIKLRDAQAKLMDVGKRKAVLMAKLGAKVGGRITSAKIVGHSRLVYELE
jgi:hypothetical protein